jgi:hypothetical protein
MNLMIAVTLAGIGLGAATWALDTAIEHHVLGTAGHLTTMQQIEAEVCNFEGRAYPGIVPARLTAAQHLRNAMEQTLQAVQGIEPRTQLRWECHWNGSIWNRGLSFTRHSMGMFSYAASSLVPAAGLVVLLALLVVLKPCMALTRFLAMRYVEEATVDVPTKASVRFSPVFVLAQGLSFVALIIWGVAWLLSRASPN